MVEWNGDAKEAVKTSFYRGNEGYKRPKTPRTQKVMKKSSCLKREGPPWCDRVAHHGV